MCRASTTITGNPAAYSSRYSHIPSDDAVFEPKRGFQDPVTYPEEGFPVGERLSRSSKFPLLWASKAQA